MAFVDGLTTLRGRRRTTARVLSAAVLLGGGAAAAFATKAFAGAFG